MRISTMSYPIEDIEGIGPSYGEKLRAAGLQTTQQLLDRCYDRPGRKTMAEATGLSDKLILNWTNKADLMRISGVGPQFSELLEAAGVDTVKELRTRNAANLAAKMREVNEQKKLTRRSPPADTVSRWVEDAKVLAPIMTY
jgi:predicted flap endonuclease-1-like 5' DNA nuclease